MKIAILGYGRMGKAIESIALERGHQIQALINCEEDWLRYDKALREADAAIDFSLPETALDNIQKCFDRKLALVIGTTGWHDHIPAIKKTCEEHDHKVIFASNFSIGVNLFFRLNQQLAELMQPYNEYDVQMNEIHHTAKLDAPSGTAISLGQDIIERIERKTSWVKGEAQTVDELGIASERIENVVGTHEIRYESDIDDITIRHAAKNRKGFALGAVIAAEKIQGSEGFKEFRELLF